MTINETNTKTKYSLIAIKKDDSQNIDKSKKYSMFEDKEIKGKLFYVMPEKFSGYELYTSIISQLKTYTGIDINIDLNSFLSITDSKDNEKFFFSLIPALNFISKTPYTRKTKEVKTVNFNLLLKDIKKYESILNESINISNDQTFCRKLQDMPSADMYPQSFVDEMKDLFSDVESKVKISIMSYDELVKKGLLLLTGVGKAADEEKYLPKLMVIEYNNSTSKDKYAFVGKGVCFDTGGMNIKTGPNMR
jgi:leucyl aminopeptidase